MKRGISHVEVILAFVLFIGFLIFGIYFFNPLNNDRVLDSTLDYAKREILGNISTDISLYSLKANGQGSVNVKISPTDLGVSNFNGARAEDRLGGRVGSSVQGGQLFVQLPSDRFVKITLGDFSSPEDSIDTGAQPISSLGFNISSSEIRKVYGERKMIALKQAYETDYNALKEAFNLPRRTDFDFSISYGGNFVNASIGAPDEVEIYSGTERIELQRQDGNVEFADLVVRVW